MPAGRRLIAAVVIAAVVNSGCTLLGLGAGAIADASARPTTIPGWQVQAVRHGASVILQLRDGTTVSGTYEGLEASDILIRTKAGTRERVDPAQVASVTLPAKKGGKGNGVLIGAAIDVAFLLYVAYSLAHASDEGEFCSPLVSSFDGRSYVPEVDAFGGAMFKRARYTDWAPLEAVRPVDGQYRLKIEKGRAETEFVDELRVVVIDHPADVLVRPDPSGVLRTLRAPAAPSVARGLDGRQALDLVAVPDGRFWVSSPFGRDPDDLSTVRDGLVLEFPRPPGSSFVKLLVRAQNTSWAYHLRGEFLSLLGRDFDAWHARIESSAESYRTFREAMLREVMLTVSLGDGTEWRPAASVWEAGSAIPRDVVVPLRLPDSAGERLRVRLDATAGLWMLDAVQADYSADLPLRPREIAPSRATDESGRDVTAPLHRADGQAYVMRGPAATAEVVFSMPPPVAGLERTVVLKATGHYLFDHVGGDDGESRLAEVDRLMNEPGAWGRWSLGLLQARVQRALAEMTPTCGDSKRCW